MAARGSTESGEARLAALIEDTVERSAILKAVEKLDGRDRRGSLSRTLAHPLLLTLVGFLLTALIGTMIESRFSEAQRQAEAVRMEVELALTDERRAAEDMLELFALLQARTSLGGMLQSAITRGDDAAVLERKRLYDQAFLQWNVRLVPSLVRFRQNLSDENDVPIVHQSLSEDFVYVRVTEPLGRSDACLTAAYDAWRLAPATLAQLTCGSGREPWTEHVRGQRRLAEECLFQIMTGTLEYLRRRADARIQRTRFPDRDIPFPSPDAIVDENTCPSE